MEYNNKYNEIALERCMARIHRREVQREKQNKRLLFCGIVTAVAITVVLFAGAREKSKVYTETTVYVTAGDTLWSIAEMYCPDNMDKREYIHIIEKENDCTANIHSGDILTIRVYE